jgi:hypothetical protein
MFGRTTDDIARTLMQMHDQARVQCRFDQNQIADKMASWMALDRRFDSIHDKAALAREAMNCRASGKELDLSGRLRIDTQGAGGAPISGWR